MKKTEEKEGRFALARKRVSHFLSKLLFPDDIKCMFCGCDIQNFEEQPYCENCKKTLPFNNGHRCEICDQPISNEASICDFCQKNKKSFAKAFCPFLYDDAVKNAILRFKFSNHRYLAHPFAKLIADRILQAGTHFDVVTFVPMTPKKQKERTFNQSQLLAEEIGKILNVPVVSCFEKVKDEKSQKTLSFKERFENIANTYALSTPKATNKNQTVLIVDDVITTCATVNACAKLLNKHANKVYVCAIAREYVHPKVIQPKRHKFSIEN